MAVNAELRFLTRALPVMFFVCAGSGAATWAEDGPGHLTGVTGAALEALRGNPKQARAMLTSGEGDPPDPAALVVLASMALDGGNTREAARLVARLRAVAPGAPEVRLLDALVQERAARPQGDWIGAGINAVETAQPLGSAEPLVALEDRMLDEFMNARTSFPEQAAQELSVPDRFLARWAWPHPAGKNEVLVGEALRLATSDERQLVLLAVMDVLATTEPTGTAAMREANIEAARRAAREKLRGTPARFVSVQPGKDAKTVGEDEVAAVEALVAQEAPSFATIYADLLRILEKLDPAMGPLFAQAKAVHLTMPPTSLGTIGDRSARSRLSDTARDRLATAFTRLADRERHEGLLITDMFAVIYLGNAAMVSKDAALRTRAEAASREARALSDSMRCLYPLARLPIRSLQRAWAEQKPHERDIAQQVARRGLSCPDPTLPPKNVEEPAHDEISAPCPDPAAAPTSGR
jgi:hypothetical protein